MRGPSPLNQFKNLGVSLGKITVPFGGKTEQEKSHPGVDIANAEGTPIHSPVNGVVIVADASHKNGENNFGNTIELRDQEGNVHQFHHLGKVMASRGKTVREGQVIATMGKTGAAYSPSGSDPSNLDYRIVSKAKKYLNPGPFLPKL